MEKYLKIGHITSTRGLKGEVKVYIITNDVEEFFSKDKEVFILFEGEYIPFTCAKFTYASNNTLFLNFKDINDINQIEKYVKSDIYTIKKELKDKFYLSDLIGYEVINLKGELLGKISSYYINGERIYIEVEGKLIPYIYEIMIKKYDEENKKIIVTDYGEEVFKNA